MIASISTITTYLDDRMNPQRFLIVYLHIRLEDGYRHQLMTIYSHEDAN
jgi:hypothetical protein